MKKEESNSSSQSNQDITKNYLRSKIQIGNARGTISFEPNQIVFHHDDINTNQRQRKEEVKNWLKSSILQGDPRWNQSIITDEKFMERRTTENFIHDRSKPFQYNYRAETLGPKLQAPLEKPSKFKVTLKNTGNQVINNTTTASSTDQSELYPSTIQTFKRTQEMPCHPKFESDFSREWNLTNVITSKELKQSFQSLNESSHNNSIKKSKKFQKTTKNYVSPMQRSIDLQEEVRKQKRENTFTLEKHVFQQPEEPIDRNALVNRYAIEPSLKFKTTKHTGTWDFNKQEGRYFLFFFLFLFFISTFFYFFQFVFCLFSSCSSCLIDICGQIQVLIFMKVVVIQLKYITPIHIITLIQLYLRQDKQNLFIFSIVNN